MIPDLRPDLDRTNVDTYINGLITELDKLYIALSRDNALESKAQADITKQLVNYVRVTQVYPDKPRGTVEPPK
jgi:hypothetical protein